MASVRQTVKSKDCFIDYIETSKSETDGSELLIFAIDASVSCDHSFSSYMKKCLSEVPSHSFVSIMVFDAVISILRLCEVGGNNGTSLISSDIIPGDDDQSKLLCHLFAQGVHLCPAQVH